MDNVGIWGPKCFVGFGSEALTGQGGGCKESRLVLVGEVPALSRPSRELSHQSLSARLHGELFPHAVFDLSRKLVFEFRRIQVFPSLQGHLIFPRVLQIGVHPENVLYIYITEYL